MKIKTGDNVKVLSGRDRGKTGKIMQVIPRRDRGDVVVVVEGVNMRKKHLRRRGNTQPGQVIELAYPIHASKVQLLDPSTKQPSRVGYRVEGGVKKRVVTRTGALLS